MTFMHMIAASRATSNPGKGMDKDTDIGGLGGAFPMTRGSAVRGILNSDPEMRSRGFEALISGYWKPVYKYLRIKWKASNEEAKDLTQGFFTQVMEKDLLSGYDAGRSAFRTYVRVCLDGFVSNERASAGRLKRGGGRVMHSLDFDAAEREFRRQEISDTSNQDAYFHTEWMRDLFSRSVESLRAALESRGQGVHFQVFEQFDLADREGLTRPTYGELGAELDLSVTQVTNYLASARRAFRACVLEQLRAVTGSEDEFREEARALMGVRIE